MLAITLFVLGAAFVVYILFGYPVVLYAMAGRWARPVRREPQTPRVSILIAAHNGEAFVAEKLRSIFALNYPAENIEIILACDGCTDRTAEIARQVGGGRVRLLELAHGGKPTALNHAMRAASHEIFFFTDIRQQVDPECLRFLVESFADPQVGVVSGRLVIRKGDSREEADTGLYWKYEFWIRTQLSRIDSFFGATGACYAMRRELAVEIPPDALLDDMYEPLSAFFRGYRLIADDRARVYDYPTTLDAEFHRKVRTLSGNYQIIAAYPALLGPRNRLWFHFVSYKFGRLILPFVLLVIAVSSFFLPAPWAAIAVAAQAMLYGAALLDPWIGRRVPLKPLTSIARTFVTLMAATLLAARILFTRSSQHLWRHTSIRKSDD